MRSLNFVNKTAKVHLLIHPAKCTNLVENVAYLKQKKKHKITHKISKGTSIDENTYYIEFMLCPNLN